MDYLIVLFGLIIGFIVGVTGVGGGSLMTPVLIFYGIPAPIAIGTDLVFATVNKSISTGFYIKNKLFDLVILKYLILGSLFSLPLSFSTILFFSIDSLEFLMKIMLALFLLLSSISIFLKNYLLKSNFQIKNKEKSSILFGFLIGFSVPITSVGAGALGTAFLLIAYPLISTHKVIATEVVFATFITFISSVGHAYENNIDWVLLVSLLTGSIPSVIIGLKTQKYFPEVVLRRIVGGLLFVLSILMFLKM